MQMNILYLDHYAGSPEMGMEFRPYYLSREWVKMGHHVTIFAGDYSHLRKRNPEVERDFQIETIDGIEYVWIKTGKYSGNGIKRALTMERFVRKLYIHAKRISKRWTPDLVIASSTYPLDTYAAQRIAKYSQAEYVHEVHDMWPATLYEVGGMSKKNPFVVAMQIAENSAYRNCSKCVSLLPYAKDYMVEHGLVPDKFVNIQNGIEQEEWENAEEIPDEHKKFFNEHKEQFVVGYFGGHALSNALDKSLDVAKKFLEEGDGETIFVFVGDGIEKKKLVERVEAEKISNAYFLRPVSKKSVPNLLQHFDCSYMTGVDSPLYRFGLCLNKLYDSMMAGIPIVCAFDAPDTLVRIHTCGFQCSPSDVDQVIFSLKKLKALTEEERKRMGANGRNAVLKHYTYKQLAKEFLENV